MAALGDADGDSIPDVLQGQRQEGGGMQRLKELKEMLNAGLITPEEYEAKKGEILTEL